jgi:hypothetical protein
MTTQIATLDSGNFAEMAKAMGMSADMGKETKAKSSTLPRLRIWNQPVMGEVEVKGKMKNMEVVPAGMYRLQLPDDTYIYAEQANIRVFVQRFMYKRYDSENGTYVKTMMADDLNGDLKDNTGGLNCAILGEVELVNPVDADGNEKDMDVHPFIWEVENKDAFKIMGQPFTMMAKQRRLPVQHMITCGSEERKLPTGSSFFLPTATVDFANSIDLDNADQQKFADYIEWINNYNEYIVNAWNEKRAEKMSAEDEELVEDFIDIEVEGDD